jgi:uncharacterized membrane protein
VSGKSDDKPPPYRGGSIRTGRIAAWVFVLIGILILIGNFFAFAREGFDFNAMTEFGGRRAVGGTPAWFAVPVISLIGIGCIVFGAALLVGAKRASAALRERNNAVNPSQSHKESNKDLNELFDLDL